jgi:ADP-heptose:LPS heptosyltransferase
MNITKNINGARRILLRRLTKNIGASHVDEKIDSLGKVEINRILICRPNHRLGNLLLITPILQEVIETFPHCKIDLLVKGNIAPTLFRDYENINQIIQLPKKPFKDLTKYIQGWIAIRKQRYDLVINVAHNSSSGRLSAQFANSKYKFFGDDNKDHELKYKDGKHIAKYPIYQLRHYLTKLGFKERDKPPASLNLKLSLLELADGQKILKNIVNNEKPTISLFTYATGNKCYSESWWEKFYARLKNEYPSHNIIEVLPIENVSKISFKAPTYYGTDIREMGSLIANTQVFIGADSGIMHLANASQTPTVGLFSVTDPTVYGPYNNNSVGINTNQSTMDDCIKIVDKILLKKDFATHPDSER